MSTRLQVKFYTREGNWDLVGNNFPVFFVRDGIKFPDMVHALKPNPKNHIQENWRIADFFSHIPEAMHMVRALPCLLLRFLAVALLELLCCASAACQAADAVLITMPSVLWPSSLLPDASAGSTCALAEQVPYGPSSTVPM